MPEWHAIAREASSRNGSRMRWLPFVTLAACGGGMFVDAGMDAGPDAGDAGPVDAGPLLVTMRYVYAVPQGTCAGVSHECSVSTSDDGGVARWSAVYVVDAGCARTERPASADAGPELVFDCRGRCQYDAGNNPAGGDCCSPGGYTVACQRDACVWTPP